jgi:anti-sigma factor RsiW
MKKPSPSDTESTRTGCADFQPLLFDFLSGELGAARADRVREHLRTCKDCQAEAAGIRGTLDLLKSASRVEPQVPAHLSNRHRARIFWSIAHPVLNWVTVHHLLVSILTGIALLIAVFLMCYWLRMSPSEHPATEEEVIFTITISDTASSDAARPFRVGVTPDKPPAQGPKEGTLP